MYQVRLVSIQLQDPGTTTWTLVYMQELLALLHLLPCFRSSFLECINVLSHVEDSL
jgi:hypothetical protein